jgi:hypothetical protein
LRQKKQWRVFKNTEGMANLGLYDGDTVPEEFRLDFLGFQSRFRLIVNAIYLSRGFDDSAV